MSDYVKLTNFTAKDSLPSGDPDKVVRGSEFDAEFDSIQVAIESKAEKSADGKAYLTEETDPTVPVHVKGITQENIDFWNAGGGGSLSDAPNDGKLYGRQSQAWAEAPTFEEFSVLQDQVNNLDPDGDNSIQWDEIKEKPTEFPPSAHMHEISQVNGLQDALDNAGGGSSVTYTLPVVLRSGDVQLPLTVDGAKLAVMTRGGELELPLAA